MIRWDDRYPPLDVSWLTRVENPAHVGRAPILVHGHMHVIEEWERVADPDGDYRYVKRPRWCGAAWRMSAVIHTFRKVRGVPVVDGWPATDLARLDASRWN